MAEDAIDRQLALVFEIEEAGRTAKVQLENCLLLSDRLSILRPLLKDVRPWLATVQMGRQQVAVDAILLRLERCLRRLNTVLQRCGRSTRLCVSSFYRDLHFTLKQASLSLADCLADLAVQVSPALPEAAKQARAIQAEIQQLRFVPAGKQGQAQLATVCGQATEQQRLLQQLCGSVSSLLSQLQSQDASCSCSGRCTGGCRDRDGRSKGERDKVGRQKQQGVVLSCESRAEVSGQLVRVLQQLERETVVVGVLKALCFKCGWMEESVVKKLIRDLGEQRRVVGTQRWAVDEIQQWLRRQDLSAADTCSVTLSGASSEGRDMWAIGVSCVEEPWLALLAEELVAHRDDLREVSAHVAAVNAALSRAAYNDAQDADAAGGPVDERRGGRAGRGRSTGNESTRGDIWDERKGPGGAAEDGSSGEEGVNPRRAYSGKVDLAAEQRGALVSALWYGSEEDQEAAADAVLEGCDSGAITATPSLSARVLSGKWQPALAAALKPPSSCRPPVIQSAVATSIVCLAVSDELRRSLASQGLLQALLLQIQKPHRFTLSRCLFALGQLARCDSVRCHVTESGSMSFLAPLLRSKDMEVREAAALLFKNVVFRDPPQDTQSLLATRASVVKHGAVPFLLSSLAIPDPANSSATPSIPHNPAAAAVTSETAEYMLGIVGGLAQSPRAAVPLPSRRLIACVIPHLALPSTPSVRVYAVAALAALARVNKECLTNGGVVPLLHVVRDESVGERVRLHAVSVLCGIAGLKSRDYRSLIALEGGLPPLVGLLAPAFPLDLRLLAAATLRFLAASEVVRRSLLLAGALPPLVELLRAQLPNPFTAGSAAAAVAALVPGESGSAGLPEGGRGDSGVWREQDAGGDS
ncbi:hypothetical protein CLOP_g881 [Closterium sp. NIES-67]|nr:hypothetical protein CLOP_g881 [Closterium sp. NIES-67]